MLWPSAEVTSRAGTAECNTFHQLVCNFRSFSAEDAHPSKACPEWVSSGNRKAIFFCRHGTKYIRNVYLKLKEIYELCSSVHERLSEALLGVRMYAWVRSFSYYSIRRPRFSHRCKAPLPPLQLSSARQTLHSCQPYDKNIRDYNSRKLIFII